MEKDEKTTCKDCRFFLQHYAKIDTRYHSIYCGYCLDREQGKKRNIQPYSKACGLWQPIEIQKEEEKTAIKAALLKMARQVEEICAVLSDDELNDDI